MRPAPNSILAAERASALELLGAMFGASWGGTESVDSGVELMLVYRTSRLLEFTDFQVVPADHQLRLAQSEADDGQSEAPPTSAPTSLTQSSTQNKLKDLFVPQK